MSNTFFSLLSRQWYVEIDNASDQQPLMTIQTDLSSVRHVGHDRMPTNRRQSECALKLPGLRPSSWMLAALAGGGAVDWLTCS